jgi:hypothetical protein
MEVHYGVGRHAVYLAPDNIISAVKMIWLTTPFSTMGACFGKVSIALLFKRIINRNKFQVAFLWCIIISLLLVNLLLTILTFSQCRPAKFLWEQLNPEVPYKGKCWSPKVQRNYGYFQGGTSPLMPLTPQHQYSHAPAFSSLSDLALALFPLLIIRKLHTEPKLKIGLGLVTSLGAVATVASVVKTVELRNLATPDFTWNAVPLVYWYMAENWLIIVAACIPPLAPLYFVLLGKRTKESFQVRDAGSGEGRRGFWVSGTWASSLRFGSWRSLSKKSWSDGSGALTSAGTTRTNGYVNFDTAESELVPLPVEHRMESTNHVNLSGIHKTT